MAKIDQTVWKWLVTVLVTVLLTAGGHFLVLGRTVATREDVKEVVAQENRDVREKISALEEDIDRYRDKTEEDRKMLIEIKTKVDMVLKGMGIQAEK